MNFKSSIAKSPLCKNGPVQGPKYVVCITKSPPHYNCVLTFPTFIWNWIYLHVILLDLIKYFNKFSSIHSDETQQSIVL